VGHEDVPVVAVDGGELAHCVHVQVEWSVGANDLKLHDLVKGANVLGEELDVEFLRFLWLQDPSSDCASHLRKFVILYLSFSGSPDRE
jgi:hypothetical protein